METEPTDRLLDPVDGKTEPEDRDERRVTAIVGMFRRVLQDEQQIGPGALTQIDAALRGDSSAE